MVMESRSAVAGGGGWEGREAGNGREGETAEKGKETLRDDRHLNYLDCGNSFMGAYICQSSSDLNFKYMQFIICQLYLKMLI